MGGQQILYLSQEDVRRTGRLSPKNCNEVLEKSFALVGSDDFLMGGATGAEHGIGIHFPDTSLISSMPLNAPDYRYMAMIGYVGGDFHVCGTKVYGSNVQNTSRGIPRSNHIIVLNDVETWMPLAIISGTEISNLRTGAVAGVAARHLAPANARTCGLVGAGAVNRAALTCLVSALPSLERVYVYDRLPEKSQQFLQDMKDLPLEFCVAESDQEMLPLCDVVHYATTAILPWPVVDPEWIKPGALVEISCLVNYSQSLVKGKNIVFDLLRMHEIWLKTDPGQNLATYPILRLREQGMLEGHEIKELGKLINGTQTLAHQGSTTLFMANGLPVWDVALAYSVYETAKENQIGTWLSL